MKTERLLTNETCNQNCTFCTTRKPVESASLVRSAASRLDEALALGIQELVLFGGEPTLRRDLPALIARAQRRGVRVVLETNAALVTEDMAQRLADAGLETVRVRLAAWGDAADSISQDPGGFVASLRGMARLSARGLQLEVSVTLFAGNASSLLSLPAGLTATGLPISALVLRVPVQLPAPAEALTTSQAAVLVEALDEAARLEGLTVRIDPDTFLPPCAFSKPSHTAHLYTLSQGGAVRAGYAHVAACVECRVRDRCPGLSEHALSLEPGFVPRPITKDRTRRRLTLASSQAEQIEKELVTRETVRRPDGTTLPMHTVRINFACNQACHFCFVSTHLPNASDDAIREAIREIGALGGTLALSGGEPTLNPKLEELARFAKQAGVTEIELQTNAIRLADPLLTQSLAEAGVDVAFVSLHGMSSEVSDGLTRAPGTFEKTLLGIDQLYASSIRVRLNFVFCRANKHEFPEYVRWVAARWPRAVLSVSVVAPSTDLVPMEEELIPRYSEIIEPLEAGLMIADELGLATSGFESMCGIPICLVPRGVQRYLDLADVDTAESRGEFARGAACAGCAQQTKCWGVRRRYAELYGFDELRPFAG